MPSGPPPGQGCKSGHHWLVMKAKLANGKRLWKCKFCKYSEIK